MRILATLFVAGVTLATYYTTAELFDSLLAARTDKRLKAHRLALGKRLGVRVS